MAAYLNGRLEAERAHSPRECSTADCRDCHEPVADADEDFCRGCSEPCCVDCHYLVNDEPLCRRCFAASERAVIECQRQVKAAGAIRHFAAMRASRDAEAAA